MRRVALMIVVLGLPAWAEAKDRNKVDALKVDMWGSVDDFETKKPAVKVIDREAGLQVWVNHVEGGTVTKKEKRQQTQLGTVKVKDTYLVQPKWPSPKAKSQTVTVRFSHVGYSGARVPRTGTMNFTFKR